MKLSKISVEEANEDVKGFSKSKKLSFFDLPKDTIEIVLSYLVIKDLSKLCVVNKMFKSLIEGKKIWENQLYSTFPSSKGVVTKNFKHIYCQTIKKLNQGKFYEKISNEKITCCSKSNFLKNSIRRIRSR